MICEGEVYGRYYLKESEDEEEVEGKKKESEAEKSA